MSDLGYLTRALSTLVHDPVVAASRLRGRFDQWQDARTWERLGVRPQERYAVDPNAERRFHELIDAEWPCPFVDEFEALRQDIERAGFGRPVHSRQDAAGQHMQPQAVDPHGEHSEFLREHFDADMTVSRAAFCAVRHLRLESVVETGVARGVTSRVMLEALRRNGAGHLWSIDLPHPHTTRFNQIGSAVTAELRPQWTLELGSSREYLPSVLRDAGPVGAFIQDSLHTKRNVCFELRLAWEGLRPGGILLVDDVHMNLGFEAFVRSIAVDTWVVGERMNRDALWGAIVKPGVRADPRSRPAGD